jgi:hypothetical protein
VALGNQHPTLALPKKEPFHPKTLTVKKYKIAIVVVVVVVVVVIIIIIISKKLSP